MNNFLAAAAVLRGDKRIANMKMITAGAVLAAAIYPAIKPADVSAATVPISTVYSGGAGAYNLSGTVTAVLNVASTTNTFSVQDASGTVLCYAVPKATYNASAGDTITFTATNTPYQGAPELVASGFSLSSNASGTAPSPAVLTIPQFVAAGNGSVAGSASVPYAEAIVTLDNVSFSTDPSTLAPNSTYGLVDASGNTTNLYTYKSDSLVVAGFNASNLAYSSYGGTYDITGYTDVYYGVPEIYPTSITQISSSPVPEPASLSLLGLGAVGLLSRRRRTVS